MRAASHKVNVLFFSASSLLLSACVAVLDLERFSTIVRGSMNYDDLDFSVKAMKSHVDERFEFRIIDSDNIVQCRGIVDPVDSPDFGLSVRNAVPKVNPPYRLDFYADHDHNGDCSGIGTDHSWRVEPLADYPSSLGRTDDGAYSVAYEHNASFTDLNVWPRNNPTANPPKDTNAPAIAHVENLPDSAIVPHELERDVVAPLDPGLFLRDRGLVENRGARVLPSVPLDLPGELVDERMLDVRDEHLPKWHEQLVQQSGEDQPGRPRFTTHAAYCASLCASDNCLNPAARQRNCPQAANGASEFTSRRYGGRCASSVTQHGAPRTRFIRVCFR